MRTAHTLDTQLHTEPSARTLSYATSDQASVDEAFDEVLGRLLPCRNSDPEIWFAERTTQVEAAKALCQQCPMIAGCLAGALEREEPWGVWGGEVFVDGSVVAMKRGRGRPRKEQAQPMLAPAMATAA